MDNNWNPAGDLVYVLVFCCVGLFFGGIAVGLFIAALL